MRLSLHVMGGPGDITLDPGAQALDARALQAAVASASGELLRLETKYSRYRDDSIISRINHGAGSGRWIPVDDETRELLAFADRLHAETGGRFDPTSGVLRRVWDFRVQRAPSPAAVAGLLPMIGWDRVERSPDGTRLRLAAAGMELDFGGLVKEYAVDRAVAYLLEAGIRGGYVNLAGDLRVIGARADGCAWQLGIRDPRLTDETVSGVGLRQGALATSGDYERYVEVGGRRYCHILDPKTGWPVDHWRSVSVIAPLCIAAGALATCAMLLGAEALDFLDGNGVQYLAIDAAGRRHSNAPDLFHRS